MAVKSKAVCKCIPMYNIVHVSDGSGTQDLGFWFWKCNEECVEGKLNKDFIDSLWHI